MAGLTQDLVSAFFFLFFQNRTYVLNSKNIDFLWKTAEFAYGKMKNSPLQFGGACRILKFEVVESGG